MDAETSQRQPPAIDAGEMIRRKVIEAELATLDGQVRSFGRTRDKLTAAGQDAVGYYRRLEQRRAGLSGELSALPSAGAAPPGKIRPGAPLPQFGDSLLTRQIAPARFHPGPGIWGFGTSGYVQAAPAADNYSIVPQGQYPVTGAITDVPGGYPGSVQFDGNPAVGPAEIDPSQYNPAVSYYWLRTWEYLIPFPPPTMLSTLTYRFDAYAFVSLFNGGIGQLMAFVSLGETADLMQGVSVPVTIDGGWPLNDDLSEPGPFYNGSYGYLDGSATVQRTFEVGSGSVPGVAIVVGVVVGLPMQSSVDLYFAGTGYSHLAISTDNQVGRIAYSYEPVPVFE